MVQLLAAYHRYAFTLFLFGGRGSSPPLLTVSWRVTFDPTQAASVSVGSWGGLAWEQQWRSLCGEEHAPAGTDHLHELAFWVSLSLLWLFVSPAHKARHSGLRWWAELQLSEGHCFPPGCTARCVCQVM